jgi:serine phosphatase RsbU (regulator of sigma subunit)
MGRINNLGRSWLDHLQNAGGLSSDTDEQRLRKAVLIFLASICSVLGVLWGLAYLALDQPLAGSIPLSYSVISGASLFHFFRTKHYRFFCRGQLALILIFPCILQWSLGSFSASGAVIIWSILAPIGALMFAGTTRAVPWFLAYVLLMILSGFLPASGLPAATRKPVTVVISFMMNIGGVSAIVFILLKYFVHAREQALAALDKEHRRVRHSLSLAMEVQQNLLPKTDPRIDGLTIAGKIVYCDETGGDYYDFLESRNGDRGKIGVVVGDVSDHGISSALLMATARGIIRQRASIAGGIDALVADANRQLARDIKDSGRFMTLFYAEINRPRKTMRWLSAGHEPAIFYDPISDSFDRLSGEGSLPLGIMENAEYAEVKRIIAPGQLLVIATDGIFEAQNPQGEMFGKHRVYDVIRQNASAHAREIQHALFDAVHQFQKEAISEDDMTLVVIKIEPD